LPEQAALPVLAEDYATVSRIASRFIDLRKSDITFDVPAQKA
jgi:hypothetical protein